MGNCWALLTPREGSVNVNAEPGTEKVLQVVKMDGKILEFRAPVVVKDVLLEFSGSGIGLSKAVNRHLPLDYELKLGRVYYILPSSPSLDSASAPAPSPSPPRHSVPSMADHVNQTGGSGIKRIKLVITKQELQRLLTKQISVDEVLAVAAAAAGVEKTSHNYASSPRYWKPKLESISEEEN